MSFPIFTSKMSNTALISNFKKSVSESSINFPVESEPIARHKETKAEILPEDYLKSITRLCGVD